MRNRLLRWLYLLVWITFFVFEKRLRPVISTDFLMFIILWVGICVAAIFTEDHGSDPCRHVM